MKIHISDVGPLIGIKAPATGQELELFGVTMWVAECSGAMNGEVVEDFEVTLVPKDSQACKRELREALRKIGR